MFYVLFCCPVIIDWCLCCFDFKSSPIEIYMQERGNQRYYNVRNLPQIMESSGLNLAAFPIMGTWDSLVASEISRRIALKRSASDAALDNSALQRANSTVSVGSSSLSVYTGMPSTQKGVVDVDDDIDNISDLSIVWPQPQRQPQQQPAPAAQPAEDDGSDLDPDAFRCLLQKSPDEQQTDIRNASKRKLEGLVLQAITSWSDIHEKLVDSKKDSRMKQQRVRRLQEQLDKKKLTIADLKKPKLQDLDVHRKGACKLTWRGMISLGLRKAIALVSASSFPLASLVEVSRNTVTRSEVLTGAFFNARATVFHEVIYEILRNIANNRSSNESHQPQPDAADSLTDTQQVVPFDAQRCMESSSFTQDDMICSHFGLPRLGDTHKMTSLSSDPSEGSYIIGCTAFCSDATNSSIFQRQKLQGLIATSALLKDWQALKNLQYHNAFVAMTAL